MDPTNDLPRLGGLLSYLIRESPVPPADLAVPPGGAGAGGAAASPPVSLPPPLHAPRRDAAMRSLSRSPDVAAELVHLSMMLYSYRGASIMRQVRARNPDRRYVMK